MELIKVLIVALISFSPVGEELIAIPAGVAFGLPVFIAASVAAVSNFLPVPLLFFVFDQGNRYQNIQGWLLRRRSERVRRWMDRYGIIGLLIITPWIGAMRPPLPVSFLGCGGRGFAVRSQPALYFMLH